MANGYPSSEINVCLHLTELAGGGARSYSNLVDKSPLVSRFFFYGIVIFILRAIALDMKIVSIMTEIQGNYKNYIQLSLNWPPMSANPRAWKMLYLIHHHPR